MKNLFLKNNASEVSGNFLPILQVKQFTKKSCNIIAERDLSSEHTKLVL